MITPFYAAIFGLLFIYLSINVIKARRKAQIAVGFGEDMSLARKCRVHANFSEYVPMSLLLIYLLETQLGSIWLIHVLLLTLLVARVGHAYGVSQIKENFKFRVAGMATTFSVIVLTCLAILILSIW